jgi:pimeloyl-ACP methyl ester carboxylesterase
MMPLLALSLSLLAPGLATDSTPRFGAVRLESGVRLHYAEQGDPSGPAVILLHGYSDSWFSFSRVLPALPRTWRVIALDQRGHGESDKPSAGYTMRELAADVVDFMDAMRIERATIVGHSMGSLVAQQVAAAAPARVERLVLVGSATTGRAIIDVDAFERTVRALSDPVPIEFIREFQVSTIHRPVPDAFLERVVAESRRLPARVWHGLMAGMLADGPADGLGAARIRTLVLRGDRDAIFPASEQDALLRLIPGARLRVYDETGHAPHWELPEEVGRDVTAFVSEERP